MTCKDCIHNEVCYRREVCNDIEEHIRKLGCMDFIARADVVEVVRGRWIKRQFADEPTDFCYSCSECHLTYEVDTNYCPNCGAKMDGGNNNA